MRTGDLYLDNHAAPTKTPFTARTTDTVMYLPVNRILFTKVSRCVEK
jgi:hypothetical protein